LWPLMEKLGEPLGHLVKLVLCFWKHSSYTQCKLNGWNAFVFNRGTSQLRVSTRRTPRRFFVQSQWPHGLDAHACVRRNGNPVNDLKDCSRINSELEYTGRANWRSSRHFKFLICLQLSRI
jgi:hypothetical protein